MKNSPILAGILEVCYSLKKTLEEIGECSMDELAMHRAWAFRYGPERREDLRFARLTSAIWRQAGVEIDDETFTLLRPDDQLNEEDLMTEDQYIRDVTAYAAARGDGI